MRRPLESIVFLARSENRVSVLTALAEQSLDRHDLEATTGASRVTIGRILTEFEERGWVVRSGSEYETTQVGYAIATAVENLQRTVTAADKLEPLAGTVPSDFLPEDIGLFYDATVITPNKSDPFVTARKSAELMAAASATKILARAVTTETVAAQLEAAIEHDQVSSVVLSTSAYDTITADDPLSEMLASLLAVDGVQVYRYDGEIPVSLGIYDAETIAFGGTDDSSFPGPVVVSTAEPAIEWATDVYERYRDAATPVTVDEFSG